MQRCHTTIRSQHNAKHHRGRESSKYLGTSPITVRRCSTLTTKHDSSPTISGYAGNAAQINVTDRGTEGIHQQQNRRHFTKCRLLSVLSKFRGKFG